MGIFMKKLPNPKYLHSEIKHARHEWMCMEVKNQNGRRSRVTGTISCWNGMVESNLKLCKNDILHTFCWQGYWYLNLIQDSLLTTQHNQLISMTNITVFAKAPKDAKNLFKLFWQSINFQKIIKEMVRIKMWFWTQVMDSWLKTTIISLNCDCIMIVILRSVHTCISSWWLERILVSTGCKSAFTKMALLLFCKVVLWNVRVYDPIHHLLLLVLMMA